MSLQVSAFLSGDIISKYMKLTDNELEIQHNRINDMSFTVPPVCMGITFPC